MVTDTTFEVDLDATWDMFRGLTSIVDFGEVYTNLNSAREIWINVCTLYSHCRRTLANCNGSLPL